MKFSLAFFSIILLLFSLDIQGQEDHDWKLVKNSNSIKAYSKRMPSSELKKVKVETVLKASLSELVAAIKDAENHENWVFLNEGSKIVEEIDDFNWMYYGISDAPWPVCNRDFITQVHMEQNKTDYSITITSTSIPDYLPDTEETVRIHHICSVWTFNPIGNGTIHTTMELEVDPSGNIPIWVINMVVTKGPYKTLDGLVKELESGKYNNNKLNYIKEFVLE